MNPQTPNPLNRHRIQITLDRPRYILLDMNAMAEFEILTGNKLLELLAGANETELRNRLGIAEIRALFWAGLLDDDPDITPRQVGRLIDAYAPGGSTTEHFTWALLQILEAFVAMQGPEAKKKLEQLRQTAPFDGTGTPSNEPPTAISASSPNNSDA